MTGSQITEGGVAAGVPPQSCRLLSSGLLSTWRRKVGLLPGMGLSPGSDQPPSSGERESRRTSSRSGQGQWG